AGDCVLPARPLGRTHHRVPRSRDADEPMSVLARSTAVARPAAIAQRRFRPGRVILHTFLITMAAVWVFPLFWAVYSSLRPVGDTIQHGYLSWPSAGLSLVNYQTFLTQADLPYYYLNTLLVAAPAVILTLIGPPTIPLACPQFRPRAH